MLLFIMSLNSNSKKYFINYIQSFSEHETKLTFLYQVRAYFEFLLNQVF